MDEQEYYFSNIFLEKDETIRITFQPFLFQTVVEDENRGSLNSIQNNPINQIESYINKVRSEANILQSQYQREIEIEITGLEEGVGPTLLSTGLTLWSGSKYLSSYLYYNSNTLFHHNQEELCKSSNLTVLELGSGLGLTGLLSGRLNSKRKKEFGPTSTKSSFVNCCCGRVVLLTDGDHQAIPKLSQNLNQNTLYEYSLMLTSNNVQHILKDHCHYCQKIQSQEPCFKPTKKSRERENECMSPTFYCKLLWGQKEESQILNQSFPHGFDLILGADIIYSPSSLGPLISTVSDLIKKPSLPTTLPSQISLSSSVSLSLSLDLSFSLSKSISQGMNGRVVIERNKLQGLIENLTQQNIHSVELILRILINQRDRGLFILQFAPRNVFIGDFLSLCRQNNLLYIPLNPFLPFPSLSLSLFTSCGIGSTFNSLSLPVEFGQFHQCMMDN